MPAVTDIGIDLGTSSIIVYVRGRGIIMQEPSLAAYDKDSEKVIAFGEEAEQKISRGAGNLMGIRPLKGGVISDYVITEKMLQYFIQRSMGPMRLFKPHIVLCIPSGVTEIERRAVEEAAWQAGARDVALVKEPIVAAMGAGINIMRPEGTMIVNIGGGVTEIAVLSLAGVASSQTLKTAGDTFDEAIVQYARENYDLFIGERTAEEIKIRIGTSDRTRRLQQVEVRGRNIKTGNARTVVLTSEEIRDAVTGPVIQIVDAVRTVLGGTPPELASDVQERGIILTGGGAQLEGLAEAIAHETGISCILADEPQTAVARGLGEYLQVMQQFERRN